MSLPCKERLTDYTPEEIDALAEGHAKVPNSEDIDRGDYLSIIATGLENLPKRPFSDTISL